MNTSSDLPSRDLPAADQPSPDVQTIVVPRTSDLGDGFSVRRALPSAQRRTVGPFVFLDEMGPALLAPGHGLDVRPHPHIGLATVTYLFDGEILHRDSLGTVQPIRPGELNWMTAGRGIVHSERTPASLRTAESRTWGLQLWVALPRAHEEAEPAFVHHDDADLPRLEAEGVSLRVMVGGLHGLRSPVSTLSEMTYAEIVLQPGARIDIPAGHPERALYLLEGTATLGAGASAVRVEPGRLVVLAPGRVVTVAADARTDANGNADDDRADAGTFAAARFVLVSGDALDGPRYVWWNFVSSSRERIEQAKADWQAGRFPAVPQETEFIPLPQRPPAAPSYP